MKPNRIEPPTIHVRSPENQESTLNEYEYTKLRVNIRNASVAGWSWLTPEGTWHPIMPNGKSSLEPPQFDLTEKQFMEFSGVDPQRIFRKS